MYFFGIQVAVRALYKTSCTYSMAYHSAYPDIENLKSASTKKYILLPFGPYVKPLAL